MPREVKIRTSYQSDAAYLMRLSKAIEMDEKRSNEWKANAIGHCNALVIVLIGADTEYRKTAHNRHG